MRYKVVAILLFLGLNFVLSRNLVENWGYEKIHDKLHPDFHSSINSSKFLVVGTSRTHYGFMPKIFDEELETSSYNLGVGGVMNPQIFQILDFALEQDSCTTILLELSNISNPIQNNLATSRFLFWIDQEKASFWLDYFLSNDCNENLDFAWNIVKSFLSKQVNLGMGKDWLNFLHHPPQQLYSGKKARGFSSLENLARIDSKMAGMHQEFLSDTSIIAEKVKAIQTANITSKEQTVCSTYATLLKQYIQKAEKKGIRLIYFMPPLIEDPSILFSIFYTLPEENRIDLSDPKKYPELYLSKNLFDRGHYNEKGAALFSRELALQTKALLH
jgi:hypothetical protein